MYILEVMVLFLLSHIATNKQTNKQFIITLTYVVGSTTKNHNSLVFKVQIMLLVKQTNQR